MHYLPKVAQMPFFNRKTYSIFPPGLARTHYLPLQPWQQRESFHSVLLGFSDLGSSGGQSLVWITDQQKKSENKEAWEGAGGDKEIQQGSLPSLSLFISCFITTEFAFCSKMIPGPLWKAGKSNWRQKLKAGDTWVAARSAGGCQGYLVLVPRHQAWWKHHLILFPEQSYEAIIVNSILPVTQKVKVTPQSHTARER